MAGVGGGPWKLQLSINSGLKNSGLIVIAYLEAQGYNKSCKITFLIQQGM